MKLLLSLSLTCQPKSPHIFVAITAKLLTLKFCCCLCVLPANAYWETINLLIRKGSRVVNGLFKFLNALRRVIVAETFPNEPTGKML